VNCPLPEEEKFQTIKEFLMKQQIYLNVFGYYVPETILTNDDLQRVVDTNDEWILSRTGIAESSIAGPDESNSEMSLRAAKMALASAGMAPDGLTGILCATATPDSMVPSNGVRIQQKLGVRHAMSMDVNAACTGFLYGLLTAQGLLAVEPEGRLLLLASEHLTGRANWLDRATCVLFGDAAGAVVMSTTEQKAQGPSPLSCNALLEGVMCCSDAAGVDLLRMTDCGPGGRPYKLGDMVGEEFFVRMNGREIYKYAVRNMPEICTKLMRKLGYGILDIDVLIPHQANLRIIEATGERLNMPPEKVFINIQKYGNTSAASVPLAICEALEQEVIRPGMRVLLTAFGGGFTWGAAVLKF
jgi:3-oxoacyl-[acyl-carrier-protein] synthase-3